MLLVQTYVAPSSIDGIGLFAGEDIPVDTEIWRFVPGFDIRWTEAEWQALPAQAQAYVRHYGYLDKGTGKWSLDGDAMRFENHAEHPSVTDKDGKIVAARTILKGEELTGDYELFDADWKKKL